MIGTALMPRLVSFRRPVRYAIRAGNPLHPVPTLVNESPNGPQGHIDTSARDSSGAYERHIAETLKPEEGTLDATRFLASAPADV